MKIWLPCADAVGGLKTLTEFLDQGLREAGHQSQITWFPYRWRYSPFRLRRLPTPPGTDVIVANSCHAFALSRNHARLIACTPHTVFDAAYRPYCSVSQRVFHALVLKRFEASSFRAADAIVAISEYSAASARNLFPGINPTVIHPGVDTGFFCPAPGETPRSPKQRARLLFVGDLTKRKGADLLPAIMQRLGPGFELYYTAAARRNVSLPSRGNMYPLGPLSKTELRDQYRRADLLLFPTRFEGFSMGVAEAMCCGTPVVTSACSALPELIQDTRTGRLCPVEDVEAFAAAIQALCTQRDVLTQMGIRARQAMESRFTIERMTKQYLDLMREL